MKELKSVIVELVAKHKDILEMAFCLLVIHAVRMIMMSW